MAEETPKTTQPSATSKIVTQAKEYVGAAVEKAQGFLNPTTPEETPKTEAPKTDEPAVALEPTTSEIGKHTKVYAEAAEAAVVKQADDIKSKVIEVTTNDGESAEPKGEKKEDIKTKVTTAAGGALEATKVGVGKYADKAQDYLNFTTTTTAPTVDEGDKE